MPEKWTNFNINKPQPPLEEGEKTEDSKTGSQAMDRRKFLKLAAIGAASLLVPKEVMGKQERKEKPAPPEVKFEFLTQGTKRKMTGESTSLNELHKAVSNNFERIIEGELKNPSNRLAMGNFKASIGRKNGKYIMEHSVDLKPIKKEEDAHRVIGIRGKVWSGKGAKEGVIDLYKEEIPPWQERMGEKYPDIEFSSESQQGGTDNLYQWTCLLKGSKKK